MCEMQDDTLTGTLSSVDVATKENLENLVKVGEKLLKKPVSRVNLDTGVFEPADEMTNEKALIKYTSTQVLYIIVIYVASQFMLLIILF